MNESLIRASTSGPKKATGGSVTVKAGRLQLTEGSEIQTNTTGAGNAGRLKVEAQDIILLDRSFLFAKNNHQDATGRAGRITVLAPGRLRLTGGSQISAITDGPGTGGNIVIEAGEVVLEGAFLDSKGNFFPSTIKAGTSRVGRGGNITISAVHLRVTEGAQIGVSTEGPGDAGKLTIRAREIVLKKPIRLRHPDGRVLFFRPTIFARSANPRVGCGDCGDGGDITIAGYKNNAKADRVHLKDGAEISASTRGLGKGGNLNIHAKEVILKNGLRVTTKSGIKQVSNSSLNATARGTTADCGEDCGHGGRVTIKAERLQLKQGGGINVSTDGSGRGGHMTITADEVVLEGRFDSSVREGGFEAVLAAQTRGEDEGSGHGGNITITAGRLQLKQNAAIRADTSGPGQGGRLTINVGELVVNGGKIVRASGEIQDTGENVGTGNTGRININAKDLELRNGGIVTTTTIGDGDAGPIRITKAASIKLINGGTIASESGLSDPKLGLVVGHGDAGRVSVDAERLEITEGGSITTTTRGLGLGGTTKITADEIVLQGRGSGLFARAEGTAAGSGGGGALTVNAGSLMVKEGATISASTSGPGKGGKLSTRAARRGEYHL